MLGVNRPLLSQVFRTSLRPLPEDLAVRFSESSADPQCSLHVLQPRFPRVLNEDLPQPGLINRVSPYVPKPFSDNLQILYYLMEFYAERALQMKQPAPEILALARELNLTTAKSLSLALETNGNGFHGFVLELPGAYVRGPTEKEAVSKTSGEAGSYLAWLGQERKQFPPARIVQTHRCKLMVEDADCEILLADDRGPTTDREFQHLVELSRYSGLIFTKLYDSAEFKDWVDEARIRKTFYGENKKTIKEIFDHVKRTQRYYLSRTGIPLSGDEALPFMKIRESSLDSLARLFRKQGNSKVYNVENEEWTLKKILRRFVWHDRIHGKAITRILEKQRQLGLIDKYEDAFQFKIHDAVATSRRPSPRI